MICSENIPYNYVSFDNYFGNPDPLYIIYTSNTAEWQNGVFKIDNNKPHYKWLIYEDSASKVINEPPLEIKKRGFREKIRLITKLKKLEQR
jgi:hypothetical protein